MANIIIIIRYMYTIYIIKHSEFFCNAYKIQNTEILFYIVGIVLDCTWWNIGLLEFNEVRSFIKLRCQNIHKFLW